MSDTEEERQEVVVVTPPNKQSRADGSDEDLVILSKWVKKDLFNKVQFIYNTLEDLRIGEVINRMFVRDCHKQLVGLRILRDASPFEKRKYVDRLWREATEKKSNLVTTSLNARRSSIYSSMQNRFTGKKSQVQDECGNHERFV